MLTTTESETGQLLLNLFPGNVQGVYVDVGAGYPIWYSNSYPFRARNWQIIAIEPQPKMCAEFRARGYDVLEYACAATDIGLTSFEVLDYAGGLGGSAFKVLDQHPPELKTTIMVQAFRLDTLLARFHPSLTHIDILGIDVEYYELDVLRGFSIERYTPTVLVIENLPESGMWHNLHYHDLHRHYDDVGYKIIGLAGYNEILVRK